jgi:D-glycero-D-manno-heptose 1,7-bisphosphate phosphatase
MMLSQTTHSAPKLIILDRDGVINHERADFIKSPEEWEPLPGSLEAIAELTRAGFRVVVASNQSGLARGLFDLPTLSAIHAKMKRRVAEAGGRLDGIFFCPHGPEDDCACRKPRPGLLREIGRTLRVSLGDVPCVGDRLRDLQAAAAIGARPVLVLTGKGQETRDLGNLPPGTVIFPDLSHLARSLAA